MVDPNVLYSFDGYKRKVLIPTYQGKKVSLKIIRVSSYRRFKMSAYGKQVENVSFINFRPLWPFLHLKKALTFYSYTHINNELHSHIILQSHN